VKAGRKSLRDLREPGRSCQLEWLSELQSCIQPSKPASLAQWAQQHLLAGRAAWSPRASMAQVQKGAVCSKLHLDQNCAISESHSHPFKPRGNSVQILTQRWLEHGFFNDKREAQHSSHLVIPGEHLQCMPTLLWQPTHLVWFGLAFDGIWARLAPIGSATADCERKKMKTCKRCC
jgi:hypothetical protein